MTFTSDFICRLDGRFTPAELQLIKEHLEAHCAGYEIQPKTRALTLDRETIPDCYRVFMVSKKIEGCSDKTLQLYSLYLVQFFESARLPIEAITNNTIRRFLFELKDTRQVSDVTLDNCRRILSSFFTWAVNEGYIARNPMATVKRIRCEKKEKHALTDEELAKIREACKNIREKALLEVMYSTGVRVSELCALDIEDVDFITRRVVVRCGKGKKSRETYLSGKAVVLLRGYLEGRKDSGKALFVSSKKPYLRLKAGGIQRILNDIGNRAGISVHIHPHMIRRTFATDALDHGMALSEIQTLLGHSKPETTMIYAQINEQNVRAAHRKAII